MKLTIIKSAALAILVAACASCSSKTFDMNRVAQAIAYGEQALTLTNDQMAAYSKQSIAAMDAKNKVLPASSPYVQRLNKLTAGLTNLDGLPLNFKVYQTNEVNAFACPDGSVRVYTGIMDLMNDDELLGIIGHEIGHVAMQHSKNAMQHQLLEIAGMQLLGSTGSTMAALTSGQLAQLALNYSTSKFSRKQENEADDFGYDFIKGAGKNPYSMVAAFEKIQKLENSGNNAAASYAAKMFSSHPETAERIAHIEKRCKADGYKRTK